MTSFFSLNGLSTTLLRVKEKLTSFFLGLGLVVSSLFFSMIVFIILFSLFYKPLFFINHSQSLPGWLYVSEGSFLDKIFFSASHDFVHPNRPLTKGDIVVFCPTPQQTKLALEKGYLKRGLACPGLTNALLKEVFALSGEHVQIKVLPFSLSSDHDLSSVPMGQHPYSALYLNEEPLPDIVLFSQDREGKSLESFFLPGKSYLVPEESFLPLSSSPYSWDGRYFGFMPESTVISRVRKVF